MLINPKDISKHDMLEYYEVIVFKRCNLEQLKHYQEEIAKDYVHFKMINLHYQALLDRYIKYIDELIEEKEWNTQQN